MRLCNQYIHLVAISTVECALSHSLIYMQANTGDSHKAAMQDTVPFLKSCKILLQEAKTLFLCISPVTTRDFLYISSFFFGRCAGATRRRRLIRGAAAEKLVHSSQLGVTRSSGASSHQRARSPAALTAVIDG